MVYKCVSQSTLQISYARIMWFSLHQFYSHDSIQAPHMELAEHASHNCHSHGNSQHPNSQYPLSSTRHIFVTIDHYTIITASPPKSAAGPDATDEHSLPMHNVLVLHDTTMSNDSSMTLWQFPDLNDCRQTVSENVIGLRYRCSARLLSCCLGLKYAF